MNEIELLKKLLSFKTVTPNEDGAYHFICKYLNDFKSIKLDKNGVKNIFLYKRFGEAEHLCFAGHIDVVPPGEGWNSDPFTPIEKDGYIYARGTQDMKGGLAAFICAVKDTQNFNGTLSILLTSDEEGPGQYGTKEVLKLLKEKDLLPDMAIVAEPTCDKIFGDTIKIGRRGSINGKLTLQGKQAHAAYPSKGINPVELISPILPKIAGINLDNGDEYFEPSKFVITDIRAGMQVVNVTPNKLEMMFNVRNSTNTKKEDIQNLIDTHFKDLDYEVELTQSSYPFITNQKSIIIDKLKNSIKNILGIEPTLGTSGGTSDARFLAEYKIPTVEFGVRNDRAHGINERVLIEEVTNLYLIFKDLISKI